MCRRRKAQIVLLVMAKLFATSNSETKGVFAFSFMFKSDLYQSPMGNSNLMFAQRALVKQNGTYTHKMTNDLESEKDW